MNSIFKNKKEWLKLSEDELLNYKNEIYNYYRKNGFPYFPIDKEWRLKEFQKLLNFDFTSCIDTENKTITQTMHGLSLCWSYHPYHYEIPCNDQKTVMGTFNDEETFKKVIAKRLKIGDNITDNGIRKMLKIFSGVQCVSNFRPTAAAAIYHHFAGSGSTVFDMSHGFGGRVLGGSIAKVNYIGVDPSSRAFKGVSEMCSDFNLPAKLYNIGSECDLPIGDSSVDLCFTSPPYFNCEKYSIEETQSYVKYPNKDLWVNGFIMDTFNNCERILKESGTMIINIQDVKSYKNLVSDIIEAAKKCNFRHVDTWKLQLSNLGGSGFKTEPLLIFKKS